MKIISLLVLSIIAYNGVAQIRVGTLNLKAKEIYKILDSDIVVADSLIMGDSSKIILDVSKKENFLHFKWISIGSGCSIIGRGKQGAIGGKGANGANGVGPCVDAKPGQNGFKGGNGEDGRNLTMYLSNISIKGSLIIDLSGGDGGDGGKGGTGGHGGAGTRVCQGGDAGNGGNGGDGGNGGESGKLNINCQNCEVDLRTIEGTLMIMRLYGGYAGIGGKMGIAGRVGTGSVKDGASGKNGIDGNEGISAKHGLFIYLPK